MREQFSWSNLVHVAISLLDRYAVATRGQAHECQVQSVQLVPSSRCWKSSYITMLLGGVITIFYATNLQAEPTSSRKGARVEAAGVPGVQGAPGIPIGLYLVQTLSANDEPGTSPMVSFPVSSTKLSAGKMIAPATWPASQWISSAFFIIGDDLQSLNWLKANHQVLRLAGATGLVVNVASEEAFKLIEREANGIVVMPWTSAWLEESLAELNGGFYPVLIGSDGKLKQDLQISTGASHE